MAVQTNDETGTVTIICDGCDTVAEKRPGGNNNPPDGWHVLVTYENGFPSQNGPRHLCPLVPCYAKALKKAAG